MLHFWVDSRFCSPASDSLSRLYDHGNPHHKGSYIDLMNGKAATILNKNFLKAHFELVKEFLSMIEGHETTIENPQ